MTIFDVLQLVPKDKGYYATTEFHWFVASPNSMEEEQTVLAQRWKSQAPGCLDVWVAIPTTYLED